jgi:hypothetical protein
MSLFQKGFQCSFSYFLLLLCNCLKMVLILDTGTNFYHLVRYGFSDYQYLQLFQFLLVKSWKHAVIHMFFCGYCTFVCLNK